MIKLLNTAADNFVARSIRNITGFEVSHNALQINNTVWESAHDTGVKCYTLEEWLEKYGTPHSVYELRGLDESIVESRFKSIDGKKYDWSPLICYPLHINYISKDRWNCSRSIAWACRELIPHKNYHRCLPGYLRGIGHACEFTFSQG